MAMTRNPEFADAATCVALDWETYTVFPLCMSDHVVPETWKRTRHH
jgi:hypothetical protein